MLRSVILAIALAGAAHTAHAQDAAGTLTIDLTGLEPHGAILLQVFDSEAGYASGDGVAQARIEIVSDAAQVEFADLPPGQYAFRLFHDLDGDNELDTNPFGVPIEPFAFSNNARGRFGPPSWDDAVFTLNPGANLQQIDLGGR